MKRKTLKSIVPCQVSALHPLWNTTKPQIIPFPVTMPNFKNPLNWGLQVMAKDPGMLGTAMGAAFENRMAKDKMVYVSRGNLPRAARLQLIRSVKSFEPIQLQVNDADQKSKEIKQFFDQTFLKLSKKMHPFGYHRDITLFVTGPGHTYNDHCDGDDGFLFQFYGVKRLQMWGPQPRFFKQVLLDLNFRGKPKMFSGKVTEYEIRAGQGLFIPRGVMHRVIVPKGSTSVSLSIRMDHHYPFLEVCRDLSRRVKDSVAYTPPPEGTHWDKFRAIYFDPSRFAKAFLKNPKSAKTMPKPLKAAMLKAIRSRTNQHQKMLPDLLDNWWHDLSKRRNFCPTGPLPGAPANRLELLKKWEMERLGLAQKKA